jgi:hypothetical protein
MLQATVLSSYASRQHPSAGSLSLGLQKLFPFDLHPTGTS